MARTKHGFCPMHRIAYLRELDAVCPQCTQARIQPPKQLDFDAREGVPVDAAGKPIDLDAAGG